MVRLSASLLAIFGSYLLAAPVSEDPKSPGPNQRTYSFHLLDVEYRQMVEEFAKQAGLEVIGDVPAGRATFDCGEETMDFDLALNRINTLLLNTLRFVWRGDTGLELHPLQGHTLHGGPRLFKSVDEFRGSPLPGHKLALVAITRKDRLSDERRAVKKYLPDYVRVTELEERNALLFFGTAADLRHYLPLAEMLENCGADCEVKRIDLRGLKSEVAIRELEGVLGDLRIQLDISQSDQPTEIRNRPGTPETAQTTDSPVWIDQSHGVVILTCPKNHAEEVDRVLIRLLSH